MCREFEMKTKQVWNWNVTKHYQVSVKSNTGKLSQANEKKTVEDISSRSM